MSYYPEFARLLNRELNRHDRLTAAGFAEADTPEVTPGSHAEARVSHRLTRAQPASVSVRLQRTRAPEWAP